MGLSILYSFVLQILIASLLQIPSFAIKKSYVVYMGEHPHGHGADQTTVDFDSVRNSHFEILGACVGGHEKARDKIFYSYTRHINGFAAVLEEEEAAEIAKNPNVASVFLNKPVKLHTTRSWDFLGLEKDGVIPPGSIWEKAKFGEGIIIGSLDTGVWPESKSFSDEGMGPVPKRWRGGCDITEGVPCNRKLIGARYFNKGYNKIIGNLNSTSSTARDEEGHGSHTLSTAGGSFVPGANVFGFGNGTAKGGSPKAHVAAYKVCWKPVNGTGCFDADILAGFDSAIWDGVDVISLSVGGNPSEFFEDGISIGSFHAVRRGITVVCSAGNDGPTPATVSNVSPWMITVGASTIDREFTSYVKLGNNKQFKGESLSVKAMPSNRFYPLISGADAKAANASVKLATQCVAGTLDPVKVKGKILVCLRGTSDRVDKGKVAVLAAAVGMILANDKLNGNKLNQDFHILPASHINFTDGQAVFAYINSTRNPRAHIFPVTEIGVKPAPVMAEFSSRGPSKIEPAILKPDITAPGVNILAAYTEAVGPTKEPTDAVRVPFTVMSGTSMSCPHVSGIVGLLKKLHPEWSPAAIKSAIMTTARTRSNKKQRMLDSNNHKATPFDYGAGHLRPNTAMDPGLVYDLTVDDYLNFLCGRCYNQSQIKLFSIKPHTCPPSFSMADFNYPSITVVDLTVNGSVTVTRRVKNVGSFPATYNAKVVAPPGVSVTVKPASLMFVKTGEEKTFQVDFQAKGVVRPRDYVFGRLIWSDGKHYVRSPLVVKHK